MIDKRCYKVLPRLYRHKALSEDYINKITSHKDAKRGNPIISTLLSEHYISKAESNGIPDPEGGWIECITSYKITIQGCAYIENRRRDKRNFWVPYILTTLIALLSLIASIADHWEIILSWLSLSNLHS